MAAQVAQHEFHRVPLAHGDGVGVHQPAGGVLVVGQHGLEPLAVLLVHRLQYFIGDLLRELLEDVGEVVGFESGREFGDFGGVVFAQELALQVFIEVLDDLAPGVLVEQLPQHAAGLGRRGFEQVRDGGGGQGFDHLPHLVERAAFQRELQQAQAVAVMLGVGHEAGPERVAPMDSSSYDTRDFRRSLPERGLQPPRGPRLRPGLRFQRAASSL